MKKTFPARALSNWIYNWYRDKIRHPKYRWWLILGTLVYLLDPFDFSPDMLPLVGWIDDGLVVTALVSEVSQLMRDNLKKQNKKSTSNPVSPEVETVNVNAMSIG